MKADEIKEYYPLSWKDEAKALSIEFKDVIKRIIVGSKSPQDFYTLKNYLRNSGNEWAVDLVKRSLCPMR